MRQRETQPRPVVLPPGDSQTESRKIPAREASSLIVGPAEIGGLVADRYLGFRRAVIWGAVLLCIGHFGMALEGAPARLVDGAVVREAWSLQVFYLSTAFIIIARVV